MNIFSRTGKSYAFWVSWHGMTYMYVYTVWTLDINVLHTYMHVCTVHTYSYTCLLTFNPDFKEIGMLCKTSKNRM